MLIPFGDLVAIDGRTRAAIAEPRLVKYRTDSLGYRNDADYAGQQVLLVGVTARGQERRARHDRWPGGST